MGEAFVPLVVHAVEHVGQPTDARLAQHDSHPRVRVQDATEDQLGHSFDHAQLEHRQPRADERLHLSVIRRPPRVEDRADGVQMDDGVAFVRGLPHRGELAAPQRHQFVGHRQLDRTLTAREPADLVGRR